ncbi:tRNA pseudouridine synthase A [bacterium]|nr:tRNA pseudouridine synthase A [bacterium]
MKSSEPLIRRYKLSISYDGSKFYGSQIQKDKPTVSGNLSGALKKVLGISPRVIYASRTDRSVHAKENVCSFAASVKMPELAFKRALNAELGRYVRINRLRKTDDSFNPRYGCLSKIYRYYVSRKEILPYRSDYCLSVPQKLDRAKMEKAALLLVGKKNFRHLSSCSNRENTTCDVLNCRISKGKSDFFIEIEGSHFLYKMARTAAAFIISSGTGEIEPAALGAVLEGRRNRIAPAPACGLYLWRVKYLAR